MRLALTFFFILTVEGRFRGGNVIITDEMFQGSKARFLSLYTTDLQQYINSATLGSIADYHSTQICNQSSKGALPGAYESSTVVWGSKAKYTPPQFSNPTVEILDGAQFKISSLISNMRVSVPVTGTASSGFCDPCRCFISTDAWSTVNIEATAAVTAIVTVSVKEGTLFASVAPLVTSNTTIAGNVDSWLTKEAILYLDQTNFDEKVRVAVNNSLDSFVRGLNAYLQPSDPTDQSYMVYPDTKLQWWFTNITSIPRSQLLLTLDFDLIYLSSPPQSFHTTEDFSPPSDYVEVIGSRHLLSGLRVTSTFLQAIAWVGSIRNTIDQSAVQTVVDAQLFGTTAVTEPNVTIVGKNSLHLDFSLCSIGVLCRQCNSSTHVPFLAAQIREFSTNAVIIPFNLDGLLGISLNITRVNLDTSIMKITQPDLLLPQELVDSIVRTAVNSSLFAINSELYAGRLSLPSKTQGLFPHAEFALVPLEPIGKTGYFQFLSFCETNKSNPLPPADYCDHVPAINLQLSASMHFGEALELSNDSNSVQLLLSVYSGENSSICQFGAYNSNYRVIAVNVSKTTKLDAQCVHLGPGARGFGWISLLNADQVNWEDPDAEFNATLHTGCIWNCNECQNNGLIVSRGQCAPVETTDMNVTLHHARSFLSHSNCEATFAERPPWVGSDFVVIPCDTSDSTDWTFVGHVNQSCEAQESGGVPPFDYVLSKNSNASSHDILGRACKSCDARVGCVENTVVLQGNAAPCQQWSDKTSTKLVPMSTLGVCTRQKRPPTSAPTSAPTPTTPSPPRPTNPPQALENAIGVTMLVIAVLCTLLCWFREKVQRCISCCCGFTFWACGPVVLPFSKIISYIKERVRSAIQTEDEVLDKIHGNLTHGIGVCMALLGVAWKVFSPLSDTLQSLRVPDQVDITKAFALVEDWNRLGVGVCLSFAVLNFLCGLLPMITARYTNQGVQQIGKLETWSRLRALTVGLTLAALTMTILVPFLLVSCASLVSIRSSATLIPIVQTIIESGAKGTFTTLMFPVFILVLVCYSSSIPIGLFIGALLRVRIDGFSTDLNQVVLLSGLASSMLPFFDLVMVFATYQALNQSTQWLAIWLLHSLLSSLTVPVLQMVLRARTASPASPTTIATTTISPMTTTTTTTTITAAPAIQNGYVPITDDETDETNSLPEDRHEETCWEWAKSAPGVAWTAAIVFTGGHFFLMGWMLIILRHSRIFSTPQFFLCLNIVTFCLSVLAVGSLTHQSDHPSPPSKLAQLITSCWNRILCSQFWSRAKDRCFNAVAGLEGCIPCMIICYKFCFQVPERKEPEQFGKRTSWRRFLLPLLCLGLCYELYRQWKDLAIGHRRGQVFTWLRDWGFVINDPNSLSFLDNPLGRIHAAEIQGFWLAFAATILAWMAWIVDIAKPGKRTLSLSKFLCIVSLGLKSFSLLQLASYTYVEVSQLYKMIPPCAPLLDGDILWGMRTTVGLVFTLLVLCKMLPILLILPPTIVRVISRTRGDKVFQESHARMVMCFVSLITPLVISLPLVAARQMAGDKVVVSICLVILFVPAALGTLTVLISGVPFLLCYLLWMISYTGSWIGLIAYILTAHKELYSQFIAPILYDFGTYVVFFVELGFTSIVYTDLTVELIRKLNTKQSDNLSDDESNEESNGSRNTSLRYPTYLKSHVQLEPEYFMDEQ